jgi:hypothetical protein
MNLTATIIKRLLKRKMATAVLVTASLAAFATLGDGGGKKGEKFENAAPFAFNSKNFSLRTGYNYKSNNLLSLPSQKQFIILNTVATYEKGNATYVLPIKKKVLLEKIKFNPARN